MGIAFFRWRPFIIISNYVVSKNRLLQPGHTFYRPYCPCSLGMWVLYQHNFYRNFQKLFELVHRNSHFTYRNTYTWIQFFFSCFVRSIRHEISYRVNRYGRMTSPELSGLILFGIRIAMKEFLPFSGSSSSAALVFLQLVAFSCREAIANFSSSCAIHQTLREA